MDDLLIEFTSKKIRVNLKQVIKGQPKSETLNAEDARSIEDGRKYAIQASIVRCGFMFDNEDARGSLNELRYRIMKSRKTMKIGTLTEEVIMHLSRQFKPQVRDIKKVFISPNVQEAFFILLHSITGN